MEVFFIDRYDNQKINDVKSFSGYEQVVKYKSNFSRIKSFLIIDKLVKKFFKKIPKDYLKANISKEILALVKSLVFGSPVFYLYADKDAFILPLIKRKFNLKRVKVFGTLHWPVDISHDYSFYKNNLYDQFDGIISLSSSSNLYNNKKNITIPHGINLKYWQNSSNMSFLNYYLIIGVSNRNHEKQVEIINRILKIDNEAKFILICREQSVHRLYENIKNINIHEDYISDACLKELYSKAKGVILYQNYCLASNVVLESIAMQVPLITNNVGDISDYLGFDYPLYNPDEDTLKSFITSEIIRGEIVNYFKNLKIKFDWNEISSETLNFIEKRLTCVDL
jgi:hypothetical protein|tara:strand:- start:241 stop:1254 length:1014 start_codon:yes stop_codon:yes gene_type:complete